MAKKNTVSGTELRATNKALSDELTRERSKSENLVQENTLLQMQVASLKRTVEHQKTREAELHSANNELMSAALELEQEANSDLGTLKRAIVVLAKHGE